MIKSYKKHIKTMGLVWVVCLVVFVFIYYLFHKPQAAAIKTLEKQFEEKKDNYLAMLATSTEEAKSRLKQEVQAMQDKLRAYVTDGEGASTLIFDISQIANEHKVSSFSIKSKDGRGVTDIPQCANIAENNMDVSFVGNFNQFAKFLNTLERNNPLIFIDSFTVRKSNIENVTDNEVTMGLSVFVEKTQS